MPDETQNLPNQSSNLNQQFAVLRRMVMELPDTISKPLLDQLDQVINSLNTRDTAVRKHVITQLDDVRLSIKTMEFDLEATRNEKRVLEDKLRDAGLE